MRESTILKSDGEVGGGEQKRNKRLGGSGGGQAVRWGGALTIEG